MGPDAHRFAFLLHPLDDQSYADYDPSLSILDAGELREFADHMMGPHRPGTRQHRRYPVDKWREGAGRLHFVLSHTAEQFRRLPQTGAVAVLKAGLRFAIDRGARIVGLGAYTSVVSGGGALCGTKACP